MPKPRLVSLDLGNGFIKAKSSTNSVTYLSVYGVVSSMMEGFDFSFSPNHDFVIGFEDKYLAIGETVYYKGLMPISIRHTSRVEDEYYRVMFVSALAAVLGTSCVVEPIVSLPPAYYWKREEQKARLAGTYEVAIPAGKNDFRNVTFEVPLGGIRTIPEGAGAVCSIVLNERGGEYPETTLHKRKVGIVDVGTFTTDLIQLDRLKIVRGGCETIEHALSDVYKAIANYAADMGVAMEDYEWDGVLNQTYFIRGGKRESVRTVVDEWSAQLAKLIIGRMRSIWKGGNVVEDIILTGGGAYLIYPHLVEVFPHAVMLNDEKVEPHFANCEGGYRLALMLEHMGG